LDLNSVALHIRRGDYVSLGSANKYHGVLPLEYYEMAVSYALTNIQNPHFVIFSDDLLWCRQNLSLPDDSFTYVENNLGDASWQDLILMSHCRHHVIANSSFSWWGAWLADQRWGKNRIVIAPHKWFLKLEISKQDRFPSHWLIF
jgi:hypothetical protein